MATNCCYNLPFVTDIRTPSSGAVQNFIQQTHSAFYTQFSPADGTNYHYQNITSGLWTPMSQWERTNAKWGKDMTLVNATTQIAVLGTLGSTENMTLSVDDSSDVVIVELDAGLKASSAYSTYEWTGSVAVTADEPYRIMLETPSWVTNPTNIYISTTLIFQL